MEKRKHSRAGLLMTEILLALLFFAIAAAGCLQIFVRAFQVNEEAYQLKLVLNSTEDLIQRWKREDGSLQPLLESYEWTEKNPSGGKIFFDDGGKCCEETEKEYELEITLWEQEMLSKILIVGRDCQGSEVYRVETAMVFEG